jgi:glycerophosphoryl diester phosphodiesterase
LKIYGHGSLEPDNLINSRGSFLRLARLGIDGVELDVRRTVDDALVVIHDARYPDGRAVDETTAVDRPDEILLLAEALDLCGGLEVNIELKNYPEGECFDPDERLADRVVELLGHRGHQDRVIASSFGLACIDRVRALRPEIPTAHLVLSRRLAVEVVRPAVEHDHGLVHPYESMVDEDFMACCRGANLRVNVWTGFDETEETIESLLGLGVDGVITANPQRALRVRAAEA